MCSPSGTKTKHDFCCHLPVHENLYHSNVTLYTLRLISLIRKGGAPNWWWWHNVPSGIIHLEHQYITYLNILVPKAGTCVNMFLYALPDTSFLYDSGILGIYESISTLPWYVVPHSTTGAADPTLTNSPRIPSWKCLISAKWPIHSEDHQLRLNIRIIDNFIHTVH